MRIKVALIGANGQLGTDIVKVFSKDPTYKVIPLTHKDVEITDSELAKKVLGQLSPDLVLNTAAYHKVDEVEDNPDKAFLVNSIAVKNLADYCENKNITLAFISTDYVFGQDKKRRKPYKETDRPGPVNVYGISKLAGEYFVKIICSKYFIVRTSGLFGMAGSSGKGGNFVELMIRLAKEGGEVKIVKDQVLSPTYTRNLAENLKELLKTDNYGLYHMVSKGHCSWYDFTKKIFELTRTRVKLKAINSEMTGGKAKRPSFSVLVNANLQKLSLDLMNNWEENLKQYLREKRYI